MPVQFATHDDLAARLGVTLASDEQSRADTLLQRASGLIQREARQIIDEVDGDVLTIPGSPEDRIRLPERPIISVASVVLNSVVLVEGTDWYRAGDFLVNRRGWGYASQPLVITYSHGYAVIPDAINAVCVEMVVRVWVNPGNTMHEYFGSERIVFAMQATPTGMLLNDAEKMVIHDVLRRTSGSVALR